MKFTIIRKPYVIKIEDFFNKESAREVFDEAIKLQPWFENVDDGYGKENAKQDKEVNFLTTYGQNIDKSPMNIRLNIILKSPIIDSLLLSSPYPLNQLRYLTNIQTQLSRYGGEGDKFDWHVDAINARRQISMIYYMIKEPAKFDGGNIEFSEGPISEGKLIQNDETVTLIPRNNMALIFGSYTPHRVLPIVIPTDKWEDGRFSFNCWLGK